MLKEKFAFLENGIRNLERLFKSKSPPLIGCDISSSSVKLAEIVEVGRNMYRIERYAIEPLPHDAVVDGNIVNLEAVADALKRGWKKMGTRVKNLALALPAAAVISKKIILPAGQQEQELELQVETEANQYIPFSLDEVNLDFQVLGPAPNNPDEVEVLIVASRKEKIEDRVAAAEAAGLKPVVMDVGAFAEQTAFELIEQQFPNGGKDQNIAIVDVGTTMMHLSVIRNDQSVYIREQPFGGNQLTQEIQRKYGMSREEAETAKRTEHLPEGYRAEILQPFMNALGMEIARALQFFFASTPYNQVHHILLAGGCAAIPGIDEVVAQCTQVETLVANPFAHMAYSAKIRPKHLTSDAPSLMIACGLAMRRFDA